MLDFSRSTCSETQGHLQILICPLSRPIQALSKVYCKTIIAFIAQLVGNVINTALAYVMLCWNHLQLAFVLYMHGNVLISKNATRNNECLTCRNEEPFYRPSVDASTEAEGKHSISVQELEVHYGVCTLCIHPSATICMMTTSVFCHVTCCVYLFRTAPSAAMQVPKYHL